MSLGTLFVDLKANTAQFVGDMGKASVIARNAARDISREFDQLGKVASQTFGPFAKLNPVVSELSFALSQMGSAASGAMGSFGKISSTLGAVASFGAGAAAAVATAAMAVTALAVHTAESADEMYHQAQTAGVATSQLFALSFAAKQNEVDQGTLVKALQILNREIYNAATGVPLAVNAFKTLGVNIRDANGQVKDAGTIFPELMKKFAGMSNTGTQAVEKIALMRQLMGRSGDALAPMAEGLQKNIDLFSKLSGMSGPQLEQLAQSSHTFSETLGEVSEAAGGVGKQITVALLPALQTMATAFANSFKDPTSDLRIDLGLTIGALAGVIKWTLDIGQAFFTVFKEIGQYVGDLWGEIYQFGAGVYSIIARSLHFDFGGMVAAAQDGFTKMRGVLDQFLADSAKDWEDHRKFRDGIFSKLPPASPQKPALPADLQPIPKFGHGGEEGDTIAEMVSKLAAEAQAQASLASATDRTTAAMVLQKATAEAFQKIGDTRADLLKKLATLTDEQGRAKGTPEAPRIQADIERVKYLLSELLLDTPQIEALYARIGSNKFADTAREAAQKAADGIEDQTAAVRRLAAAYADSPLAVEKAQEATKVDPLQRQLDDLEKLKASGAIAATVYEGLAEQIQKQIAAVSVFSELDESKNLAEIIAQLRLETDEQGKNTVAVLSGAAALRQYNIEKQVRGIAQANPLLDDTALNAYRKQLAAKSDDERLSAAAQQVSASQQYQATADQIGGLELLRQKEMEVGADAAAIAATDTTIGQLRIKFIEEYNQALSNAQNAELFGNASLLESQQKLTELWDAKAREAGTFGDRVTAIFDKVQMDGQKFGEHVFDAFSHAIDDVSTQLAKMAVTGKSNFKQLATSMEEELLKAQIQRGFAAILTGIKPPGSRAMDEKPPGSASAPHSVLGTLGGMFGIASKAKGAAGPSGPTGAPGSPFHVILDGGAGGPLAGFGGAPAGAGAEAPGSLFDQLKLPLTGEGVSSGGSFSAGGMLENLARSASGGGGSNSSISGDISSALKASSGILSTIKGIGGLFNPGKGMSSGGVTANGGLADLSNLPLTGEGSAGGNDTASAFDLLAQQAPSGQGAPSGNGAAATAFGAVGAAASTVSLFASIMKIFSGFRAGGGDVSPGKAYMVGENHPEFFVPNQAGKIMPSLRTGSPQSGHTTVVNMHIHGVQDADSFNRSKGQILSGFHQQASIAYARHSR